MQHKKTTHLLLIALTAVLSGGATGLLVHCYTRSAECVRRNLVYTEQMDYLLRVLVYRLERGDARDELTGQLRDLSANYGISYEGQPFLEYMAEFMEEGIERPPLEYCQPFPLGMGEVVEAERVSRILWTLPLQPTGAAPGAGGAP
jgi:hypothetical protein